MALRYIRFTLSVLSILLFLAAGASPLLAQRQYNVWYFGEQAGLDFNSGAPVPRLDSRMSSLEGCATIADRTTGKLLFYTNGRTIWNRDHQVMLNGNDLKGHWSSTMSSVIVPMPGDSNRYYIFTVDAGYYTDPPHEGLNYSVVDMTRDGGRGEVVENNVHLADTAAEKVVAVRKCHTQEYWVITRAVESNGFYAFHVTDKGVSKTPVISYTGIVSKQYVLSSLGYMKASPDGSRLAVGFYMHDTVEVYDFDIETGVVSNPMQVKSRAYGLTFSPDNSKLYVLSEPTSSDYILGLLQYDVTRRNSAALDASRVRIADLMANGAMQIGPDRKIYCALAGDTMLSVIQNPNVAGLGCDFRARSIDLKGRICQYGLPNHIDGELLGTDMKVSPDVEICYGDSIRLTASGATYYGWAPADGLSCSDCASPMAAPRITTTYSVRMFNNICESFDTVTVTVLPTPEVKTDLPEYICTGDTTRLHAEGAERYEWRPASGLSCTNCPDPFAYPPTTTTYTVVGFSSDGCRDSMNVTVNVGDTNQVETVPNVAICAGDNVRLGVTPGKSYRWSPATGLSCTDCQNPVASPTVTTLYSVVVENWAGCVGSDTVRVSILTPENVSAGPDVTICSSDSVQLTATGDGRFLWTPGDGLSCTDCRSPMASPKQTTTYRLTVGSDDRCSITDSVTVTVQEVPIVDAGESQTTCRGGSVQLQASEGGMYQWSPSAGLSCTDCRNPVARPEETTMYRVRVTGANGCHGEDTVWVRVADEVMVDAGGGGVICQGESVQLSATGGGATYRWSPSAGLSCVDCSNPVASPVVSTLYSVVVTSRDGCIGSDTVRVEVRTASIDAGEGGVICIGDSMQLTAMHGGSEGGGRYRWSPSVGLSCDECSNPVASPDVTTVYGVEWISRDGCRATDSVTVVVRDGAVAHLSIGNGYHAGSGGVADIPVMLDDQLLVMPGDTLEINLRYDPDFVILDDIARDGLLLDGWSMTTVRNKRGDIVLRLIAPPGATDLNTGTILRLSMRPFLGSKFASELAVTATSSNPCVSIETVGGKIRLDSICGLNFRLMDFAASKYSLSQNDPNPFNPTTRIRFSVAFDGPTRLAVFNAVGEVMAVLVDEELAAGEYEAVWDAGTASSGLYYYTLRSGSWSATRRMVVVK